MVRKVLAIRTDNGLGDNNPTFHDIEITEYSFSSPRMGMPTLTATLMWPTCLDDEWTGKEYIVLRGEKYYIRQTQTSEKSNTDARYKHSLEFKSEREQLAHVYFYDVVPSWSSTYDRPNTNSTEFKLFATIREYADRLNCALRYAGIGDSILNTKTSLTDSDTPVGDGYCVVVSGYGDGDLTASKEIEFADQWLWDALTEGYKKFDIPFSFRGKKIVFNEYVPVTDHTFKYGYDNSLLSVKKTNANARIVNRITFKGSSENIPYYYPNETEYGKSVLNIPSTNKVFTSSKVSLTNEARLLSKVKEGAAMTVVSRGVDAEVTIIDLLDDEEFLSKDGDWFKMTGNTSVQTQVEITFNVKRGGDYYLNSLLAQCWLPNTASPAFGNNNMELVDSISTDTSYVVKQGQTQKQFLTTKNTKGYIPLGTLDAGVWTLVATVDINIEQAGSWYVSFYNATISDYNKDVGMGVYWRVGNGFYNSLLLFGITTDAELTAAAVGDTLSWSANGRMPFQTSLVPPKYRDTLGAERFYNALNNTYPDGAAGYLTFPTPYVAGNPMEYVYVNEDIKPTIEGVTNSVGQLLGQIAAIAFDSDDNDSLVSDATEDNDKNDALKYEHSFFYIKLHHFSGTNGFDLFNSASQTDAMTLQMTSGKCNGCKFKIQVIKDDELNEKGWRNPVQVKSANGDIVDGTYTDKVDPDNPQDFQQDTTENELWICVQKDASTFGVIMPNRSHNYMPEVGDTFNIININLPKGYVTAAEKRGEDAMLRFMAENNEEKFNFSISASRIFFAEHPVLLSQLDENSVIRIEYDGKLYEQYVSTFGIDCKDGEALPDVRLELTGTLTAGQSFIEEIVASVPKYQPTGGGGGGLSTALADARYIRRDIPDRIQYRLSTDDGFEVGKFISGMAGGFFGIDPVSGQTYLETDMLKVRMRAVFEELLVSKVSSVQGKLVITPGGGIDVTFVEEIETGYMCYFKMKDDDKGARCSFEEGDHVICREFNVSAGLSVNASNQYYWRRVDEVNNVAGYVVLSKTDCLANSSVPKAGDTLVQLGHEQYTERQTAIVISTVDDNSPCIDAYSGIDSYTLVGKRLISLGQDSSGNVYFRLGKDDADKYLLYEQDKGLTVSGDISVKSTIGGTNIDDYISNKTGAVTELYRLDLTNEMAPVACDSDGNVTGTYPTSTARVFKGSTQLTSGVAYSIAKKEGITNVAISTSGAITMSGLTADRAEITVQATVDTVVLTAVMNVYKVKPGADGNNGTSVTITSQSITYQVSASGTTAPTGTWSTNVPNVPEGQYLWTKTVVTYSDGTSTTAYSVSRYGVDGTSAKTVKVIADSQVMSYTEDFTSGPTPASVHLSAELQGTSGYQWSYKTPSMNSFVNISGATSSAYTLAHNDSIWGTGLTNKSITIRCTSSGVSDEVTIAKVSSGKNGDNGIDGINGTDGYTVLLSNESHVFEGDTEKAVPTSVDCKIIAYKGNTRVPATIGAVTGGVGGMSMSYVNNGTTEALVRVYVTSSMTAKQGVLNIPITVDGQTFTRNFSWSLSLQGADGESVTITSTDVLYCVGNYPTQPQDFRFTLTSLSGVTLKQGDYLWSKTIVTYSDGTSVVSYSASRIGADGENGTPGTNGSNGLTSYVHFAYCSSINGSLPHPTSVGGFSTTSFAGAKYIGLCTDYTQADPTTHSSYEWNEYRGQDGAPGAPGEDAVIYEIITSVDEVLRDADGNLTPSTVNCSVYKIKGALRSLSNDLSLRYKILPDDTSWHSLSRSSGVSSNITVSDTAQSIVFELYSGSMIYGHQTVPVLTDASGYSGGENLLKGTNQGTSYWSSSIYGSAGTSGSGAGDIRPYMLLKEMDGIPRGLVATNQVSYPYSRTSQTNVPQSVSYQLEFATDSYFQLLKDKKYMVGFDIAIKGSGPVYFFLEAQRKNTTSWVTLTPWLYNGNMGSSVIHIGAKLNTLTSDLTNVRCIRLSVVATQTNEYTTSGSTQVGRYRVDSIEISNLKIEQGLIQTPWTPALRDTDYLTQAFKESTTISGGVVMTSRVRVGYTDSTGEWVEVGGLNGIATDYSGTVTSTAPILYCGGPMVDAAEDASSDHATSMIRLDGTAYFADNTVRMEHNSMNIGDNIVLDEDGLHLIDTSSDTEKLLVTNKTIGTLSNIQNSASVNLPSVSGSTLSFYRSTGAGSTTDIQPLAGYYLKSMTQKTIAINNGNAIGAGGMSLNASIQMSFNLSSWQTNYILEANVAVLLQMRYGSSSYTTIKTYPLNFKVGANGRASSDTVQITANLAQGYYYQLVILCTKDAALNNSATTSISSTYTVSGSAQSTMNKNVLGNDGLVSVWGNTVLMAKSGEVTGIVGDASLRIRSWQVELKYGSTPNNGIRIQSDGIWIYVPQSDVAAWKRLDISKLWGQGLLLS